jgi:hypothetical protein
MDTQTAINLIGGAILAVIGWFARRLYEATENLRRDIHEIEKDLPISYVRKEDFDKRMDRIEHMLEKIFEKLEGKVDR